MDLAGIIVIGFIIVFGFLFIHTTNKVNTLEIKTRDRGSEIDTSLWDRTFRLSKVVEILNEKGIEHDINSPNINELGIGSAATIQSMKAEQLDKEDVKLRALIKSHQELMSDEDFTRELGKFNTAREEMFRYSLAYNKSVNAYNSYISGLPASIIAMFHKKKDKAIFIYYFKELQK